MAAGGVPAADTQVVGSVVIGRNEGERLKRCLAGLAGLRVVYVDSGSSDGSVAAARAAGAAVVELPVPPKFTAARARNAGLAELLKLHPDIAFVQLIDGDCEVREGWIATALAALMQDGKLAVACGRRRERYPDRSIYNALCDDEWNTPVGEAAACGGDALMRVSALQSVGGYSDDMIAGEEPDLCARLRAKGWGIRRLDAEMTWHDADMTSFKQFWNRARRAGHAFAELAQRHPDLRWPDWRRSTFSIVVWGAVMPLLLLIALGLAIWHTPLWWVLVVALAGIWPLKMLQIARRQRGKGLSARVATASGVLTMTGKLAEVAGVFSYHRNRLFGRQSQLIEYK